MIQNLISFLFILFPVCFFVLDPFPLILAMTMILDVSFINLTVQYTQPLMLLLHPDTQALYTHAPKYPGTIHTGTQVLYTQALRCHTPRHPGTQAPRHPGTIYPDNQAPKYYYIHPSHCYTQATPRH